MLLSQVQAYIALVLGFVVALAIVQIGDIQEDKPFIFFIMWFVSCMCIVVVGSLAFAPT